MLFLKIPIYPFLLTKKKKKSFPVEIHFVALAKATLLSN